MTTPATPARYRTKPVVIEAMQTDGTLATARLIEAFSEGKAFPSRYHNDRGTCWEMSVRTPEGHMNASEGDWVIRGVKGEFYPRKPDIFDATYEAV